MMPIMPILAESIVSGEDVSGVMHFVGVLVAIPLLLLAYRKHKENPRRYLKFLAGVAAYIFVFTASGLVFVTENASEAVFAVFSLLRALAIVLITLSIIGA